MTKYSLKRREDGGADVTVTLNPSMAFVKGFATVEDACHWLIDREGASFNLSPILHASTLA